MHLEGAGGGIARIGEEGLFVICPLFIELLEYLPGHQDLSPNLEVVGPVTRHQLQGDALDGLDIGGDIIALGAVAAGYCPH